MRRLDAWDGVAGLGFLLLLALLVLPLGRLLAASVVTPERQLTLRVDPTLPDLYRADYEGPPPNVYGRGGTVKVHYRRSPLDWRERAADIVLNGTIPWRIEAHGGVGELQADLRDLRLDGLELSGGLNRAELVLPRPAGTVRLRVSGGASSLVVHRPRDVAVRVQVSGGTNELTLDERLTGEQKKTALVFKVHEGSLREELDVDPGLHEVRIEVTWDDQKKVAAIVGNFRGGATRRLDASLGRMRRELTLEWH